MPPPCSDRCSSADVHLPLLLLLSPAVVFSRWWTLLVVALWPECGSMSSLLEAA
jgi:hypothetical protein